MIYGYICTVQVLVRTYNTYPTSRYINVRLIIFPSIKISPRFLALSEYIPKIVFSYANPRGFFLESLYDMYIHVLVYVHTPYKNAPQKGVTSIIQLYLH